MLNVFFLSEDIVFNLFSYLINKDQIAFISSNHFFHQQWMQTFRVINLHAPLSELFFIDIEFRQKILSKILNPSTQLSLLGLPLSKDQGRSTIEDIDESFHVSGLHRLEVGVEVYNYLMRNLDRHGIEKIEHLFILGDLGEANILDVSYLGKVTLSLKLSSLVLTDSLENYLSPTLTELKMECCRLREEEEEDDEDAELSLPPLPNLKILILDYTYIENLEEFHYLNELYLERIMMSSEQLVWFQHIPNLTIVCSEGLDDISCLQDNDNITILQCRDIIDYSRCMTRSKIIKLRFLRQTMINLLLDISVFSLVEKLTIDFSYGNMSNHQISSANVSATLKDVSLMHLTFGFDFNLFESVKRIKLEDCNGIQSLQGLENVEKVILVKMYGLTSLDGLGRNKEVEVISCNEITDFSSVRLVSRVQIQSCDGFTNAEDVAEVSNLTIISCSQLKDISALRKVDILTVTSCPQIMSIKELQSVVPILKISDCKNLRKYDATPHFDSSKRYLKIGNGLERIPDSVYGEVFKFLKGREGVEFLSTSYYLHQILMKKMRQIILKKPNSLQLFFTSPAYLSAILGKIENPLRQLQVIISSESYKSEIRSGFYCSGYQRLEMSTAYFLKLCQSSIISSFSSSSASVSSSSEGHASEGNDWKVYHLVFSNREKGPKVSFQEIESYLYKVVGYLKIDIGERIMRLGNLSRSLEKLHLGYSKETVLSLPPLPKLKVLSITSCTIKNLLDFHYLEELILTFAAITDVTPFQTIQKITFNECNQLQDISPLQSHRFIEFHNCAGITEYRNALSRCKEIVISFPNEASLIDLSHFQCVERLTLTFYGTVKVSRGLPASLREIELIGDGSFESDFNGFHGLQKVILESCCFQSLGGFGLETVREVVLQQLMHLTTLDGLQLQPGAEAVYRSVKITSCSKISDFSPLNYLHKVSIVSCDGFRNGAEVDHVHELLIDDCSNLRDISMLLNIPKLDIKNCAKLISRQNPRFTAFQRIFT